MTAANEEKLRLKLKVEDTEHNHQSSQICPRCRQPKEKFNRA